MNFSQIFSSNGIFDPVPNPNAHYFIPMVIVFSFLIIAAAAILILTKDFVRKLLIRYVPPFFTAGGLGLVHLGARYESLPWLGSVAFFVLVVLMLIVWLAIVAIWMARFTPKFIKSVEIEEKYKKYLPKAKKKAKAKI
ncbi:MAG: hypothetical protein NTW50_04475 [Candidatus Berkelbacteria bacterium]|nr:hypothetical protein [Candidatus Berkelbacteria bacterium]